MFPLPSVAFKDIKEVRPGSDWQWSVQVQVLVPRQNIIVVPNKDYKGSRKVSNKGIEYRVYRRMRIPLTPTCCLATST